MSSSAKNIITLLLLFSCGYLHAQTAIITSITQYPGGYGGDSGPAIYGKLSAPHVICLDRYGNIYIADALNNRIRKIESTTRTITTIAGTGTPGFLGDSGPATLAQLYKPESVTTDTSGNIYIGDRDNYVIRKIEVATGIITTIAGTPGIIGATGDGGPATSALLSMVTGLCFDRLGYLYFADWSNLTVRKVSPSGIITTVAGVAGATGGYIGEGGPATAAHINPTGVYADSFNNIYFTDQSYHAVRKVDATTGILTTVAGTNVAGYSGDGGVATAAKLNLPRGVFIDKGQNIFIADYPSGVVRRVDATTKIITTVAGNGTIGYSGDYGPATNAQLYCTGVCLDDTGVIYIADGLNNVIRKVCDCPGTPVTASYTIAGTNPLSFTYTGTTSFLTNIVWVFGDGDTSTVMNPMHNYSTPGEYHVCAYVYTGCGMDSSCQDIAICSPFSASFTDTGNQVRGFTYTGDTTSIDSLRWDFGDGGTDTGLNALHTYTSSGTYHACIIVYNECGRDTVCHDVVVSTVGFMDQAASKQSYTFVPNPSDGKIQLRQMVADNRPVQAEIWNSIGQSIFSSHVVFKNGIIDLNFSGQPGGLYILQVTDPVNPPSQLKFVIR